ncbi:MAG: right-handed parallel beta-helix repeat-containing protein [Planctomycetes bacterium]|nr:right-handed parallel beta-helix repeat-containing protein [Planctomycetota bacterium]
MIFPRVLPFVVVLAAATAPSAEVILRPGNDIQAAVAANPPGTTFRIARGLYRHQEITPKDNDVFIGEPGAILSGARLLTAFVREGVYWVATGQTQQGQVHGDTEPGWRSQYAEDLFIDDVALQHVPALSDVGPGKWFFDYAADKIYFANDPAGHRVETSVSRRAFAGGATGVTIRGLVIEKYAIPAQMGAIGDQYPSRSWTIIDNEVRWNHGTGINVSTGSVVRDNRVHHNGQKGIGAGGDDILIEGNEISFSNVAHFDSGWEAGGTKFANTARLTVRANYSHDNRGTGLWTDINNIDTLYERNVCADNFDAGIFHEISYRAIVRDNVVVGNGRAFDVWLWGAGILISTSRDVEIFGNTVDVASDGGNGIALIQQQRGDGAYGPYVTANCRVHDNTVVFRGVAGQTGGVADWQWDEFFAAGNTFDRNAYHVTDLAEDRFGWANAARTWTDFRTYGLEATGTIDTTLPPPTDTHPPVITALAPTWIGSTSCVVRWITDEAADGSVDYGVMSYDDRRSVGSARVTTHEALLTNLAPGRQCHVRAQGRDAAGNRAWSADLLLTTLGSSAALAATPTITASTTASTVSCATPGAVIRVTTDGSAPTPVHGAVYSAPFAVAPGTTIKAMAFASGFDASATASAIVGAPAGTTGAGTTGGGSTGGSTGGTSGGTTGSTPDDGGSHHTRCGLGGGLALALMATALAWAGSRAHRR